MEDGAENSHYAIRRCMKKVGVHSIDPKTEACRETEEGEGWGQIEWDSMWRRYSEAVGY